MPIYCDNCEVVIHDGNDLTRIDGTDYCQTCSQELTMPKDIFKMKCPECGVDHEKEANQHCLPDRFDWCDDCDTCEPISFKQHERN